MVKLYGYKLPQTIEQIAEERDQLAERCERLEGALRELAEANFAEFCGEDTERFEPDEAKG
jgi:hypothetical protein